MTSNKLSAHRTPAARTAGVPSVNHTPIASSAHRTARPTSSAGRTLLPAVLALLVVAGCTRPGESRALAELDVGTAALRDATVTATGGLAAIRELSDRRIELWSQTPDLELTLALTDTAAGAWTIVARNTPVDAVLAENGRVHARQPDGFPTVATFALTLPAGSHVLRIAPPDADRLEPYRVAAMADIQTALPIVDDVFRAISAVPGLRFVVAMGDITERGETEEYDLFERQLQTLTLPFYTTLGNHELWAPHEQFFGRYGRASFQFGFKGAAFTFVDSGDAGLDPLVERWLDGWLAGARDRAHVFLTHIPPLDPFGGRYGSFRSAADARRLLARLVEGNVDLTLYGHLHTYIAYENAGIPAYISGGGGALPMTWDGIDRHFLVLVIDPASGEIRDVETHRVPDRK
jgi:3',5'-cyclic-AMP phosphodiesterase